MKIQYGFAKFRSTCYTTDDLLFANAGDLVMFCRHEEDSIFLIFKEKSTYKIFRDQLSSETFKTTFQTVSNIYLLFTKSLKVSNFNFERDIVYQFNKHVFRSLFSKQPWLEGSDFLPLDENWETTNFFMSGTWLYDGDFKIISKKEALQYKKEYEFKMDTEKFGI